DPSSAEFIPLDLQKANARFPFGKRQFKSFMSRVGATTLIRGHERIIEGFKVVYNDDDAKLFNLFSAGGATNNELPVTRNYTEGAAAAATAAARARALAPAAAAAGAAAVPAAAAAPAPATVAAQEAVAAPAAAPATAAALAPAAPAAPVARAVADRVEAGARV